MQILTPIAATRYVTPLREGGSLPAILELEDLSLYVTKFRGAGQGVKPLLAELIVGGLATAAGLSVPDLALVEILPNFGRTEPDPEIQDLLKASVGVNVGLKYLDGAFNFDAVAAREMITAEFASRLVWLDALVINPDRTARNPNLMIWDRSPWLIDHGAALYVHYSWDDKIEERARSPFAMIKDHILLYHASELQKAGEYMYESLSQQVIDTVIAALPESLLADRISGYGDGADEARDLYLRYLRARRESSHGFLQEAIRARDALIASPPAHLSARR